MRRVYILVESSIDAAFLRRILPSEVLKYSELVPAGGRNGISSLARSLLVRRKAPVAVVIDSDSLDREVIEERRQSTEDFIRSADYSLPVRVFVAVPEIEAWLFASDALAEKVVGQKLSPDKFALAKRDPKGVLQQLAENNAKRWNLEEAVDALDAGDIEQILAIDEVAKLNEYLQSLHSNQPA